MPYQIVLSAGGTLSTVADDVIDTTSSSLSLVGRNVVGYGTAVLDDLVHMLEHFNNTTPPSQPIAGQLWYNQTTDRLTVYTNAGQWADVVSSGNVAPVFYNGIVTTNPAADANSRTWRLVDSSSSATMGDLLVEAMNDDGSVKSIALTVAPGGVVVAASSPSQSANDNSFATTSWVRTWVSNQGFAAGSTGATESWVQQNFLPIVSGNALGTPTTPLAATGDISSRVASTQWVHNQNYATNSYVQSTFAPLVSPNLTGAPQAPTPPAGDNSGKIATSQYVQNAISGYANVVVSSGLVILTPAQYGCGVLGLTSLGAPLTGNVTVLFPGTGRWTVINFTNQAGFSITCAVFGGTQSVPINPGMTTEVIGTGGNLVVGFNDFTSIAMTGVPTAPTAPSGTNSTQVATTAFVKAQGFSTGLPAVANGTLLANLSGVTGAPTGVTLSQLLDGVVGAGAGDMLVRTSGGWVGLGPGPAGYYLQTHGAGVAPSWAAVADDDSLYATTAYVNGTFWTAAYIGQNFATIASLAGDSNHQLFTSGMQLNFGSVNVASDGGVYTFSFFPAFPNACVNIVGSYNASGTPPYAVGFAPINKTTFTAQNTWTPGAGQLSLCHYIAVGY